MGKTQDQPENNASNRTVKVQPAGKAGNGQSTIRVSGAFSAHIFNRKREIDDLLVSKKLSVYTSGDLESSPELPVKLTELDIEYATLEKFAEGGQATISVARDKNLKRIVAVKSLKKNLMNQDNVEESFITEAKVTAQLDHPAIIPIYGLNNDSDDGIHLVMKLVNGKTLREYLRNVILNYRMKGIRSFDEEAALGKRLEIFLHVCDAIAYAHHRNIMHRDLKPENIMLGEYMEVYVMDWGIARKIRTPENSPPLPHDVSGTPRYFSPEALCGEQCDERSDIFTLGLILQEIVTLQFAVRGESDEQLMHRIVNNELEPVEHLFHRKIDSNLKAVIRKACAYEPAERYASVTELSEDIRRYMNGLSISARPDDVFMKTARFAYRHRRGMLTAFLAVMLAAVSLAAYSIYERLRHATEMSHRSEAMNSVYGKTAASAADFDMTALHMQDLLCSIAQTASYLLCYNTSYETMENAFYPFQPDNDRTKFPPGLVYSPFHKRQTSFECGVYKIAPDADLPEVRKFLAKVSPILPNMIRTVLESQPGVHLSQKNYEEKKKEWLEHGLPVKAVFAASKYGVTMLYPWRNTYTEDYDPRKRPWYRHALESWSPVWGQPYVDEDSASGLSIPCSMQIRDTQGNFYGVAGLDLSFNKLTENLLKAGNTGSHVLEKAIIDPEGRVILSSASQYFNRTFDPKDYVNPELEMPLFKDGIIRTMILKQGKTFGLFLIEENGREVLYSFAHLKIFNLYYVEIIDFQKLLIKNISME